MKTSIVMGTVCLSLGLVAAGCAGDAAERDQEESAEQVGSAQEALSAPYCNTVADCVGGCDCYEHQCISSGFGPLPNPPPNCSQPPPHACTTNAGCRSECICTAGTCQPDGFSPQYPFCFLPPAAVMPISGTWVDPARPGTLFNISRSGGDVFVTWFTFLSSGQPVWYNAALAPTAGYAFTGTIASATWVNGAAQSVAAGSATLSTNSVGTATFSWTLGSVSGNASIHYDVLGSGSGSAPNVTGAWYAPTQSGWGEFFDVQDNKLQAELAVYDASGKPVWLSGSATWNPSTLSFNVSLSESTGHNQCPGCTGTPSTTSQSMGSMQITGVSACHATVSVALSGALSQWNRTNLPISCLTD